MKRLLFAVVLPLSFFAAEGQASWKITGTAEYFSDGDTLILARQFPFNAFFSFTGRSDTAIIEKGKFDLQLTPSLAELFLLTVKTRDGRELYNRIFFQTDKVHIVLSDSSLNKVLAQNDVGAEQYHSFSTAISKVKPPNSYNELFKAYDSVRVENPQLGSEIFKKISKIIRQVDHERAAVSQEWISSHPESLLNAFIIYTFLMPVIPEDSLRHQFEKLSPEQVSNSWGKELSYIVKNVIKGARPPMLSQRDTSGNMISLST